MKSAISTQVSSLMPFLIVQNGVKALSFYQEAFGAIEVFRLTEPSGKIGHAEIEIGSHRLMLADEYPDFGALSPVTIGGSAVTLHLYVDDADAWFARAIAAGATELRAVKDEFFGDRVGMITDPFGHKWSLATRKEEVSPAEMQKRWLAMFA